MNFKLPNSALPLSLKTPFVKVLLIFIIIITSTAPSALAQACNGISNIECQALYALYNSTDGDNWTDNTNWLSFVPVKYWNGITVNSSRVTEIKLYENSLAGEIPVELGNLTSLQSLCLDYNSLTGPIPPELGNLTNLETLNLGSNGLTGPIPPELGNLTSLQTLNLDNNDLTDSIPTELENLSSLIYIFLGNNSIAGAIEPAIGNLANLEGLDLSNNDLTGLIPTELKNLTNLQTLSLSSNNLTGHIPPQLGNLTNLQILHLDSNNLSGLIPPELGNLTNLWQITLASNSLSGAIPSELGNLSNLQFFSLNSNNLNGSIPTELGNLTNLEYLFLDENNLTGYIPSELGQLSLLKMLTLDHNNLTGSIPKELGNLTSLLRLLLRANILSGSIPPELGNLTNLQYLYLDGNNLTGSIPKELGNLNNLEWLDLKGNYSLTGSIPKELGNLSNLERLFLTETALTGPIPPQLGNLTNLQYLMISSVYGSITGLIPPELGKLTNLKKLDLSSTQITGPIPSELGNLNNLEWLVLHRNNLSGDLPSFLANPPDYVDFRFNCLYASNPTILAVMEDKHDGQFMATQTLPPADVMAETTELEKTTENSVLLSWEPIKYSEDNGGYQIFYQETGTTSSEKSPIQSNRILTSLSETSPEYLYYGMTADKKMSSMTISNLKPGTEYSFRVDSVTWAHDENPNDLHSLGTETASAVSGTYSRAFLPNWKQAPGYWTGVVASNFGDSAFNLELSAYDSNGILDTLGQNPATTPIGPGLQKSLLGSEFLGTASQPDLSWIELGADGTNKMGSIFLFGVSDTQLMDGAEAQSAYAKKLYFTRPLDEGFFDGWGPEIQMSIVNPTDEEVTVRCVLMGSNGEAESSHTIASHGFISGDTEDLIGLNHGIVNGYMEIEVTEGNGVIGFSRVEFPGVRTALGMNAVQTTASKRFYSAQLAHGMNIVTNLRLVNTSSSTRNVTLSAIGDSGTPVADSVTVEIQSNQIYSADLGTLFGLESEGTITTGSLVVDADGNGIVGDIIFAEGDTLEYGHVPASAGPAFQGRRYSTT